VSDKANSINLDIERRHWEAGARATQQSRKATAKTETVLARHRNSGLQAMNGTAKAAKPRDRRDDGTSSYHAPLGPFARCGKAVADLLQVFGYPPAVIPDLKPARIHRIKVPADNLPPDPRPQNLPRAARPKQSDIYRLRHGVQERLCRSCAQWFTLNRDNFRWRQDRKTGSWNSECRICDNLRRREAAAKREARDL
jgi:hypothetical protein